MGGVRAGLRPQGSECSSSVLEHPPLLELPTPGLPPAPSLGTASGTREPALPCVCMCVGHFCPWARTVRALSSFRLLDRCPGQRLPLYYRPDTQAGFLNAHGLVRATEVLFMGSRHLQNK